MARYETTGEAKRALSLLDLASSTTGREQPKTGVSLLAAAVEQDSGDAATRHRLARSRREAAKSPLVKALADVGPRHDGGTFDSATPLAVAKDDGPTATATATGLRSLLRDRLFGRDRPHDAATATPAASEPVSRREPASEPPPPVAPPKKPRESRADDVPPYAAMQAPRDPASWRPLIDPVKVVSGIANSKTLIASLTIAAALLGVVVALSTPKKYESVAEMLVDPRDLRITDRDITTTGLPSDATLAIVENQVRVLTSGTVLNKVVDELNLTSDPEFNGEAETSLLKTLTNWRALFARGSGDDGGARKRAMTIDNLARSLNVERGGKTFVVSVGVTTQSPDKSALIANKMTRVFLETYGKFQSDTAGRAADELTSRLDELRREVEEAERKVETFKAENDLIGSQGRLISEDDIVSLNTQLSLARARTLELNAKASSARATTTEAAVSGALPEELTSNTMTELRSQYAALRSEADRLSARLGPRHPQRLAIDAQLEGARGQIEGELRRIISSIQVELKRAVQLEQDLASRLAQLKVGQGGVNADLVTLRELEREATAKRAVYESFLLRAKETGEQRDINAANISVISQAFPPIVSVGPSRAVTVLTFMIAGFITGVGIGGARGAWRSLRDDARARSRRDVAGDTGDPVPEPSGDGPEDGPRGGRPERKTEDDAYARQMAARVLAAPMSERVQTSREDKATNMRSSGWLDAFRRKLRQDEVAAVPTVATDAAQPFVPSAATYHPQQAPARVHPQDAMAPAAWIPLQSAHGQSPVPAWQAAAVQPALPQAPAYPQQGPAYPQAGQPYVQTVQEHAQPTPAHQPAPVSQQPIPARQQQPVAYPVVPVPYPQQSALHPQATHVEQPVAYAPQASQPAFATPQPPAPVAAAAYATHQPLTVVPGYQAQPAYPYPAHAPVQPIHLVTQPSLPPVYAYAPPQPPFPAVRPAPSPRWNDESVPGAFDRPDHRTSSKTVEELRLDLREFREAVLDLAESRGRRRHA